MLWFRPELHRSIDCTPPRRTRRGQMRRSQPSLLLRAIATVLLTLTLLGGGLANAAAADAAALAVWPEFMD